MNMIPDELKAELITGAIAIVISLIFQSWLPLMVWAVAVLGQLLSDWVNEIC